MENDTTGTHVGSGGLLTTQEKGCITSRTWKITLC